MCHTPRLWSLTAAHVVMRLPEHCSRFLPTRSSATVHRFCPRVLHSEPPGNSHLPRPRAPTSPLQLSPQVSTTPVSAADDPAFQLTPKIKAAAKDFHNCPHHADPLGLALRIQESFTPSLVRAGLSALPSQVLPLYAIPLQRAFWKSCELPPPQSFPAVA